MDPLAASDTPAHRCLALWRGPRAAAGAAVLVCGLLLAACGSGGGDGGGSGPPPDTLPAEPTSTLDATRLAQQASFGANEALVQRIAALGPAAWIQEQMRTAGSSYRQGGGASIHQWTNQDAGFCDGRADTCWRDHYSGEPLLWDYYRNALEQPDQLRQRVAYALQQIVVVSAVEVESTYGLRNYHNMLLEQAFGNYRELLRRVALSPVMGDFLNHVNNDRAAPNENFARELLQLFSVGTCQLDADGRLSGGSCRPVYDNTVVREYAHALTGWTYPAGGAAPWGCWPEGTNCRNHVGDMLPLPALHDSSVRTLLGGVVLPAGHTPAQALDKVLDSLMQHPNTAPFVARRLIQHLVTSNPAPDYVRRVAAAFSSGRFAGFGSGSPGDLAATVAALLLDPQARDPAQRSASYGRLREPALLVTGVLRALNGQTDGSPFAWWWGESLQQHLFRPPSVFNFYPPDYPLPGRTDRVGPAFALHNANTAMQRLNFLQYLIWWGGTPAAQSDALEPRDTIVRLDAFAADAATPERLVDRLATLATGEVLPVAARSAVITAVRAIDATTHGDSWPADRVRQAAWLVFASPHFQIQR